MKKALYPLIFAAGVSILLDQIFANTLTTILLFLLVIPAIALTAYDLLTHWRK